MKKRNKLCYFLTFLSWVLATILVVFLSMHTTTEQNVWTDATVGRQILTSFSVPHSDIFSFATQGEPWVAESWLYSIMIYSIIALFGIAGAHLFKIILILLMCLIIMSLTRKRRWNMGVAAVLMTIGFYLFRDLLIIRAQLFGVFLFFLLFYALSEYRSTRKYTYLYSLPAILWVWANSHPSFLIGLIMVVVFALSELVKKAVRQKFSLWYGRTFKWSVVVRIGFITLGCFAAVVLNPYFTAIFDHAFHKLSNSVLFAVMDWYVFEWVLLFNLPFLSITVFVFLCMIFVPVRRSDITDAVMLAATFLFAYFFKRYTVFPFLLTMVLAIKYFSHILDMMVKELRFMGRDYRSIGYMLSSVLFLGIVCCAWMYYYPNRTDEQFNRAVNRYPIPVDAVSYIKANGIEANVYTPFYYGGYFLYELYPLYKNFTDYHTLYVNEQTILNDQRINEADIGWEWNAEEFDLKAFLVPYESGLRNLLKQRPQFNEKLHQSPYWRLVYWDDYNLLYKRVDEIITDKFRQEIYMTLDIENMMQLFSNDILEKREIKKELIRRKEKSPSSGWCNVFLGVLSIREGDMQTGKEYLDIACKINPDIPKIRLFKEMVDWHESGAREPLADKIAFYDSGSEGVLQAAFTLMAMGLYIDAQHILDTVLEQDDKNIEAYVLKGIYSDYLGDYVHSLVALNNALKIDPNDPEILYYLGKTYQNNQIWDQAARVMREAIEMDSANYKYWYAVAEIYLQSGNLDDALAMCKKTVHFRPHYFNAWILGGNLFRKIGRYSESLDVLGKAYILNPFSERVYLELAQTYLSLDQRNKAEEALSKISDPIYKQDPHYLLVNARLAALDGNADAAYTLLAEALEKDRNDISMELKRCKEFKGFFQAERFRNLLR